MSAFNTSFNLSTPLQTNQLPFSNLLTFLVGKLMQAFHFSGGLVDSLEIARSAAVELRFENARRLLNAGLVSGRQWFARCVTSNLFLFF
ncbi:MAG: hypothetical protein C0473_01590 [Cyanobacteria bacterium DS3.002]|nr:hypothetical protein [Cyanobacteria bacterium DS3.002]MBA4049562.1 hypothetical protein [Cyanobacteria bacterium DS2.008]